MRGVETWHSLNLRPPFLPAVLPWRTTAELADAVAEAEQLNLVILPKDSESQTPRPTNS